MYGWAAVADNPCQTRWAWAIPKCWFTPPQSVAPAPSPAPDVLRVPPASEEEAQAVVDDLLNQQLEAQKRLNASRVESSWIDVASSAAVETGEVLPSALVWAGAAVGVGLLFLLMGGRR